MFPDKIWGAMQEKCVQKDSRHWWVARTRSWRMEAAGSVCHWLYYQTVPLSTKCMHESNRRTFWTQTVNNCCLLGCINELNICSPKTWMGAICTSVCVCHVLIHYLHRCTELKFTVHELSLNALHAFNLQLQGYSCGKYHLYQFRSVWDTLQNKMGRFFSEHCVISQYFTRNVHLTCYSMDDKHIQVYTKKWQNANCKTLSECHITQNYYKYTTLQSIRAVYKTDNTKTWQPQQRLHKVLGWRKIYRSLTGFTCTLNFAMRCINTN